jgi:hypothetical protein
MFITRRIFMAGLAAALSLVRVPGVSALENTDELEEDYDDTDFGPYIEYLNIGDCEDMLSGPATEAGWYLHPECMIGCCHSEGPFHSREAALEADRIRWVDIAKSSRSQNDAPLRQEDLEPF